MDSEEVKRLALSALGVKLSEIQAVALYSATMGIVKFGYLIDANVSERHALECILHGILLKHVNH